MTRPLCQSHRGQWSSAEPWRLPLLALLGLLLLGLSGGNQWFFIRLNGLSAWTGPGMWPLVTVFGDALVALALLLPFVGRQPELIWSAMIAALLAGVTVQVLKGLLGVPRPPAVLAPELLRLIGPAYRTDSFPSGHATAIFTLTGVLVLHLSARVLRLALVLAAAVVAVSRSVVGVHWPADLLAGALLGWSSAVAGSGLAARWAWGLRPWPQRLWGALLLAAAIILLLGYDTGYPSALWLQRALALSCIAAASLTWYRRWRRHG